MITFYLEVITFLGSWNFYCFTFWQLSEDYRIYTDVHYSIHTIATRRDAVVGDIWWVELSETVEPGCLPLRVRALSSSLRVSSVVEFMPHGRHLREGRLQPRNRPRWRTRSKEGQKGQEETNRRSRGFREQGHFWEVSPRHSWPSELVHLCRLPCSWEEQWVMHF